MAVNRDKALEVKADNVAQAMADLSLTRYRDLSDAEQLDFLSKAYDRNIKKEVGKKALSQNGYTLLIEAVRANRFPLLKRFLRDKGFKENTGINWTTLDTNFRDQEGLTALMHAVLVEQPKGTVEELGSNTDKSLRDNEKKTALQFAIQQGATDFFKYLAPNCYWDNHGYKHVEFCAGDFLALNQCKDKEKALITLRCMLVDFQFDKGPSAFSEASLAAVAENPKLAGLYVDFLPDKSLNLAVHPVDAWSFRKWLTQFWDKACSVAKPDYALLKAILVKEVWDDVDVVKINPQLGASLAEQALEKADLDLLRKIKAKAPDIFFKTFCENLDAITRFRTQHHAHLDFERICDLLPISAAIRYAAEQTPPQTDKLVAFAQGPQLAAAACAYYVYAVDRIEQASSSEPLLPDLKKYRDRILGQPKEVKEDNDGFVKSDIKSELAMFQAFTDSLKTKKFSPVDKGKMLLDVVQNNKRYCILMADALLDSGEVDLQVQDKNGKTALIYAVQHGLVSVADRICKMKKSFSEKEAALALKTALQARHYELIPYFTAYCSQDTLKSLMHPDVIHPPTSETLFSPHHELVKLYECYGVNNGDHLFELVLAACRRQDAQLVIFYLKDIVFIDGAWLDRLLANVDRIKITYPQGYKIWKRLLSTSIETDFSCREELRTFAVANMDVKMLFLLARTTQSPSKFITEQLAHPGILSKIVEFFKIPGNRQWIPSTSRHDSPDLGFIEQAAKGESKVFFELLNILLAEMISNRGGRNDGSWWEKVKIAIQENIDLNRDKPEQAVCVRYLELCQRYTYTYLALSDPTTRGFRVPLQFYQDYLDEIEDLGIRKAKKLMSTLKSPQDNSKIYFELQEMIAQGLAKTQDKTEWNELARAAGEWHLVTTIILQSQLDALRAKPPIAPLPSAVISSGPTLFAHPEEKKVDERIPKENLTLAEPLPMAQADDSSNEPNIF